MSSERKRRQAKGLHGTRGHDVIDEEPDDAVERGLDEWERLERDLISSGRILGPWRKAPNR